VRILRRRIERKIEVALGNNQFGFRRRKGTTDAIGVLRIISERTKHQLDATINGKIYCLVYRYCSTCIGHYNAHH